MNADGSGRADVTHDDEGVSSWPSWSPDGSRIAYSGRTRTNGIYDTSFSGHLHPESRRHCRDAAHGVGAPPGDQECYELPVWSPAG
jgi:hypothetical protein